MPGLAGVGAEPESAGGGGHGQGLAVVRDIQRMAIARPGELGRRETLRLLRRLGELSIPVGELLFNALTPEGCGAAMACQLCAPSLER